MTESGPDEQRLRRAAAAIQKLQAQVAALERRPHSAIAIVEAACRFPGSVEDLESFWRLLIAERDAIGPVPEDRWDAAALYDANPETPGKTYVTAGGFLADVNRFDAQHFGISRREAMSLDPQQRLLLELAWQALERSGVAPDSLADSRTGVFLGLASSDYGRRALSPWHLRAIDAYTGTGCAFSVGAGRISYRLGLRGPSLSLDTACSSALVALHLACQSLRSGECDMALVGAVNLILSPEMTVYFSRLHALSPDGRCKSFDATADGYGRGEGGALVVLKRLDDAVADRDPILAVIRSSAVNQDGRSNGLTAPSARAQEEVIREALARAGAAPSEVGYVEAHGTGTPLGDPIELYALAAAYGVGRPPNRPLLVGSVKTNLGHLETAAGLAGLLKAALALRHREIPASLHFHTPHPDVPWQRMPLAVAAGRTPWPTSDGPRLAGVSSFGFSGTNAHVILEEPPARAAPAATPALQVLPLSARGPDSVRRAARRWARHLLDHPELDTAAVAHTARVGRCHFEHRLTVVADSTAGLAAGLQNAAESTHTQAPRNGRSPRVAFLFSGQGARLHAVGRELYATQPLFRQVLDRCDEILGTRGDQTLLSVLYPRQAEDSPPLERASWSQPALVAIEIALASLWRHWGIEPVAVLGHSLGEYAAAWAAGVLRLEEVLELVAARAAELERLPGDGAMVDVRGDASTIAGLLEPWGDRVVVACHNAPGRLVLSGLRPALCEVVAALEERGFRSSELHVGHAFHSPQVDPALDAIERLAGAFAPRPPRLPFVSSRTGHELAPGECDARHWRRHTREAVRFDAALETLEAREIDALIEIGPEPGLLVFAATALQRRGRLWLPSLRPGRSDHQVLFDGLARLYERGAAVDWQAFDSQAKRIRLALPTYPFQRSRHWLEETGPPSETTPPGHPLIGTPVPLATRPGTRVWHTRLTLEGVPFLRDHRIQGSVVVPGAACAEMMLAGASDALRDAPWALDGLRWLAPVVLTEDTPTSLQMVLTHAPGDAAGGASVRLLASRRAQELDDAEPWRLRAEARIEPCTSPPGSQIDLERIRQRCGPATGRREFYSALDAIGLQLGASFRGLGDEVFQGHDEALARVRLPHAAAGTAGYRVHPALLDSCFQVLAQVVPENQDGPWVPSALRRFRLHRDTPREVWCHARLSATDAHAAAWIEGDLDLADDSGQILAELRGLRLQCLDGVRPPAPDGDFLVRDWQALDALRSDDVSASGRWLLVADSGSVGERLRGALEARGGRVHRLSCSDFDAAALDDELERAFPPDARCRGVVFLAGLDAAAADGADSSHLLAAALRLLQALARSPRRHVLRLWMVTRGAQAPGGGPAGLAQAPLWGLARVVAAEHPEWRCTIIDLEPSSVPGAAPRLADEILLGNEEEVVLDAGARHGARLARRPPDRSAERELQLEPASLYVITGGLGRLGLAVADWLVRRGARKLLLVSRRRPEGAPQAALEGLESRGAEVAVAAADVADREAMARVLDEHRQRTGPLRGVVHAAGVADGALLASRSVESLDTVLAPKIAGAWNLHQLTRSEELQFFVLCSSAAVLLGPPGQGAYAAGNAFLGALARYRRELRLPTLSVDWGPLEGGGMAAGSALAELGRNRGLSSLGVDQALAALEILLAAEVAEFGVVALDIRRWLEAHPHAAGSSRLERLVAATEPAPAPSVTAERQRLLAAPAGERRHLVDRILRARAGAILQIDPADVAPDAALVDIGFDSLMGLELRDSLETSLGLRLPATLLWSYPTLEDLARHLAQTLDSASTSEPTAPPELLSTDELLSQLRQELEES
ncbi:MAG: type I polyketide synthase [Acidobacteriota bacterium]